MTMSAARDPYESTKPYVLGRGGTERRYLKLLGAQFTDLPPERRTRFVADLCRDARAIADADLAAMLDLPDWRPRMTAGWLIAVDRRTAFRDRLAELLLASSVVYAGKGYAYALMRFGQPEDAEILAAYLDHYLPRLDCHYDQPFVMSALLHLDDRLGTTAATRFLTPDGPWRSRYGDADPASMRGRFSQAEELIETCLADQVSGVTGRWSTPAPPVSRSW